LKGAARDRRIAELLDLVQLPAACGGRPPGALSGGQKQRVNLARALAAEPDLILCDEVTSALDTVVAAAILDLMADLRRQLRVSYLFISHDLNTVRAICDEIVVLYAGTQVECVARPEFGRPVHHPYFELLAASVPELRTGWLDEIGASRLLALPPIAQHAHGAGLCRFLDRCPMRIAGTCDAIPPPLRGVRGRVEILCHRTGAELATLSADHSAAAAVSP
jgi:peptide/nickel transport system ATP-binding protein